MLNKVEKVEKVEDDENVKIEPEEENFAEDFAGWMDGGKMDQKSDTDDGGDPVLI